jgi:hypothetical protein
MFQTLEPIRSGLPIEREYGLLEVDRTLTHEDTTARFPSRFPASGVLSPAVPGATRTLAFVNGTAYAPNSFTDRP